MTRASHEPCPALVAALSRSLGIATGDWAVDQVEVDSDRGLLEVHLGRSSIAAHCCRRCGGGSARYDSRRRVWRHTEIWGLATAVRAEVPRTHCGEHGVQQIDVPWARRGSRMTRALEVEIRFWLRGASVRRVARRFDLPWALAARMKDHPPE